MSASIYFPAWYTIVFLTLWNLCEPDDMLAVEYSITRVPFTRVEPKIIYKYVESKPTDVPPPECNVYGAWNSVVAWKLFLRMEFDIRVYNFWADFVPS